MESAKYIERYDPLVEADKVWLEKNQMFRDQRAQMIKEEKLEPQRAAPSSEDKLEQTSTLSSYQLEKAIPNNETQAAIRQAQEEYLNDERSMAEMSVTFRTFFTRGGIGTNFDTIA